MTPEQWAHGSAAQVCFVLFCPLLLTERTRSTPRTLSDQEQLLHPKLLSQITTMLSWRIFIWCPMFLSLCKKQGTLTFKTCLGLLHLTAMQFSVPKLCYKANTSWITPLNVVLVNYMASEEALHKIKLLEKVLCLQIFWRPTTWAQPILSTWLNTFQYVLEHKWGVEFQSYSRSECICNFIIFYLKNNKQS